MISVRVQVSGWTDFHQEIQSIRRQVFIEEQQVPESEEWDNLDESAQHYLAFADDSNQPIATARLLPSGRLTRMAVLSPWRNQGVGSNMLRFVVDHAIELGHTSMTLHAQLRAEPFYARHGFIRSGGTFFEAGIEHVAMHRQIAALPVQRIEYGSQALQLLRQFSQQARRSVDIFTQTLPSGLYADTQLVDNLSRLARRDANAVIRIIVRDTRPLLSGSQPLVHLARRLPSKIEIRQYTEGAADPNYSYFCVDRNALIAFSDETVPAGFARSQARAESRKLLEDFNYLWSHGSRSDPNLRILHL